MSAAMPESMAKTRVTPKEVSVVYKMVMPDDTVHEHEIPFDPKFFRVVEHSFPVVTGVGGWKGTVPRVVPKSITLTVRKTTESGTKGEIVYDMNPRAGFEHTDQRFFMPIHEGEKIAHLWPAPGSYMVFNGRTIPDLQHDFESVLLIHGVTLDKEKS